MSQVLHKYLSKFNVLSQEELDYSISLFELDRLKKGDFFVAEQSICNQIGFVIKGAVRNFAIQPDGEENTTCFKFEDQFITSYESFSQKKPSKISIQAIEDCELQVINYKQFHQLLKKNPAWQSILAWVMEQEYLEKEQHLRTLNNKSAKEKYLHTLTHSPEIIKRVQIGYIASYLGVTHRTLSRVRKDTIYTTS
ncbi:cAMP-binding protein [Marivirga tractuosa]|uniref:Transcriptional regulator, Crp/Fnr family n=1 Tax=Marivirga tractuosa (strain ATCC 23168 / DSM 4126 / NBRC 15989 / NCIMB 1408 / VKM B-1430 / H-43) TaxID=643867 RepID=E4TTW1_MARTH|nr:Crp/Fnr family transcriptional regulator [Marivirga tractuosa]ADR22016.1 putative transcriptional regulator, Crp/Fnr family [Marivirga tractuosa DSM 4126]BDD13525.1 cAMP-binding protein [Marivirga tractuosa]